MSLKNKLVCTFLVFIMLTFLPLVLMVQYYVKPQNMAQAQHKTLQLIESKSSEIGSWLNQRISEMRIIHEYQPCQTLDFAQIKPYLTNLNKVLRENYGNTDETFAIGGLDGKGWINDNITIDVSSRQYFQKAIKETQEYIISEPVVSKSNNDPIFLICYPIKNSEGEKVGFINGAVNLKLIADITNEIEIYDGISWIMNRSGCAYTVSNQLFADNDMTSPALLKISQQATSHSGTIDMKSITGNNSTTFYAAVPYAQDWILCTTIENSKINTTSNSMINMILATCVIIIVIAAAIAVIISRSITYPIEKLKYHMLQVSQGNLDTMYIVSGNDEISVLGSVFNQMITSIKELMVRVRSVEQQKRKAELKALQSQINPHFLYNTLDTIQWKALSYNAYEVADMIQLLSKLFRISLSGGKEYITVTDEIAHVSSYLEIQLIRYRDKIRYTIEVDDAAKCSLIPKLIIQPLVENSIYHGIKPKGTLGEIKIAIGIEQESLCITVKDNGVGMSAQRLQEIRKRLSQAAEWNHYGLYNVNERLTLAYDSKYSIEINSEEHKGTEITIRIPVVSEVSQCLEY